MKFFLFLLLRSNGERWLNCFPTKHVTEKKNPAGLPDIVHLVI